MRFRGRGRALFAGALLALLLPAAAAAQAGAVAGVVVDETGRPVADAAVLLFRPPDSAAVRVVATDRLGRFRFAGLAPGRWAVRVVRIGFDDAAAESSVVAGGEQELRLVLTPRPVALDEVRAAIDRTRTRMNERAGETRLSLERRELKRVPGAGEPDVLRAIQVLPGVVTTSDFSSAYNVRGGSADQNLILLDGIPIFNPFHLGGFFSVFNTDMVARAELLAGGFPASYGGRVSSVLEVESDAAGTGVDGHGGVSLLASRLAVGADLPVEGVGLRAGRARLSLRRSYFDQIFRPVFDFPYHLLDAQGYAEAWTGGGGRLSLTGYSGRDVLDLTGVDFPLRLRWTWGNDMIGARWSQPLGAGRMLDARGGFTRFVTDIRFPDFADTHFASAIRQALLRADLVLPRGHGTTIRTGVEASALGYRNVASSGGTDFRRNRGQGTVAGAYLQADWIPADAWRLETGVRLDGWYAGDQRARHHVAPRVAVKRLLAGGEAALKAAAGRYTQHLHSLRDEEIPVGIDIWVLAGPRAPILVSDQLQVGLEGFLAADWHASVEAYWRSFEGVITNNFADDPNDQEDDLLAGTGRARGVDLALAREGGRVRTRMAVSWLRAERTFPDPMGGPAAAPITYAPVFDRRLDLEFLIGTRLAGWDTSVRWNLGSGLPHTRPLAGYRLYEYRIGDGRRQGMAADGTDSAPGVVLAPRNAARYPAYHRLDASARRTFAWDWGTLTPHVDVLNVYNRRNPLFYFYEYGRVPAQRSGISMFPLVPTVGLEVTF
ncbi:MAG: TonB-dependent receptor [Gemmatimonadota bacterium]